MRQPGTLLRQYWWIGVAVPVVLLTVLILRFSVNVPFWDSWEMVPLYQKHAAGTLRFADFWAQHNEHRILFPNLLTYGLAQITHWNVYVESIVNLVLGLTSLGVLLVLVRQTFGKSKNLLMVASIFAAWLILSPVQWENWLWGWQIEWFMSVLAVVVTLWLLVHKPLTTRLFALAMLSATVATYSLANGFIVWGVGLAVLLLRRFDWRKSLLWAVVFVVELGLYYHDYINPPYHPSKTLFLSQPVGFVHYILSYIGAPLSFHYAVSAVVGLFIIGVFSAGTGYIYVRKRSMLTGPLLVWLAMAAYAGVSAALTGVSRLGLGIEQSYSSRYTTISVLFTLSTFVVAIAALRLFLAHHDTWPVWRRRLIIGLLVGFFFATMLSTYAKGTIESARQHDKLVRARTCEQTARSPGDECLLLLYPNADVVWTRLVFLRSIHWNGL